MLIFQSHFYFYSRLIELSGDVENIQGVTPSSIKAFQFATEILKSDSHVYEHFGQIKIFLSLVQKNIIICLFGV